MDDTPLTEEDCTPNVNNCTLAGKVIKVEPLTGKVAGLSVVLRYQKHWPSGNTSEIPIRCYVTGAERVEKLAWLKPGEVVLVFGEVTDKGSVWARQLEQLSKAERVPGEDDQYLAEVQRHGQR